MKEIPSNLLGTKVRVHWNLHKDCWSVLQKGRVVGHALTVELEDASFVVLQGGYERYQRTQTKNVHAFVQGKLVKFNTPLLTNQGIEVTYSPKQNVPLFRTVERVFKGREFYLDPIQVFPRACCINKRVWLSSLTSKP
jgi:hypothetical protein